MTALVMLSFAPALASTGVKEVSAQVIACQDEATQRYLANFHQVGLPRLQSFDDMPVVVTRFQNDTPRFEEYVAECRQRQALEADSRQ